jgi:uncharacterized delta-60 repeat protein
VSYSNHRRRRWRTLATTLALTFGSLAIPAAAMADGQLDPAFNGTGYHVGTVAEGTVFNNVDTRIPMIVQGNGSVVIGGSRGGFMTLARYTAAGALDTSFGVGGFATAQFSGTPTSGPGNSGATAMTTDAAGNIIVGGFGASQSMVAARFTANGVFSAAAVCYAPHLIDYTARALAVRQNGSVVLVGYARDRHAAVAVPGSPVVMYGQRATVTIPASGTSTTACGTYSDNGGLSLGSDGVTIDGLNHDGTGADPALAGRYYEGVAALPDNRYVVVSTNGPDANVGAGNAAWVERFPAAGAGLDTTFNPLGTGSLLAVPGRLPIPNVNLHAIKLQGTDAYAAGESMDAAVAGNRQMLVTRIDTNGAFGAFGAGGIARAKIAGGNNSGQALVFQGTNVIVGGAANLGGRSAFGMARFAQAGGARDLSFGPNGQVVTPFGTPSVNGYVTGLGTNGNFVIASGRLSDPAGLATVAARYYATGAPPPPLPPPAASTGGVDQITANSARISGTVNPNGTASTWWIEYGTTAAYGSQTPAQPLASSLDDIDVQQALTGLAAGTVYHARIVVSSTQGTDPGDDVAFTTLGSAPAGGGAAGGTTGAGATTTTTPGGGTKSTTTTTAKKKARACVVPKVVGKKLNKARSTVYAKGCKAQVTYKASKKAKGTVLAQSRKAGKKLGYRSVVRLTVAKTAIAATKS